MTSVTPYEEAVRVLRRAANTEELMAPTEELMAAFRQVGELLQASLDAPGQHIVQLGGGGGAGGVWMLQHPLQCRVGGRSLFDCPFNQAAERSTWKRDAPPAVPTRYWVSLTVGRDGFEYVRLGEEVATP
jgi:hypothetical protein